MVLKLLCQIPRKVSDARARGTFWRKPITWHHQSGSWPITKEIGSVKTASSQNELMRVKPRAICGDGTFGNCFVNPFKKDDVYSELGFQTFFKG